MADEETVDMEQRRDEQPQPESGPPPSGLIASGARLSPVQRAHQDYSAHATANDCRRCGDVDRDRCSEGERLWRAWTVACDDAYRQLHHGAR